MAKRSVIVRIEIDDSDVQMIRNWIGWGINQRLTIKQALTAYCQAEIDGLISQLLEEITESEMMADRESA